MKSLTSISCILLLIFSASAVLAEEGGESSRKAEKAATKRARIDEREKNALDRLFRESSTAKELAGKAVGHAVFDNTKMQFIVSAGGGTGVAVHRSGKRTYMNMGTGGIGLGIGVKTFQVVFLFETDKAFNGFVEKGWQADAQAGAAAGTADATANTTFSNGLAVFVLSKKGLIASADVSGTKYWKDGDLN